MLKKTILFYIVMITFNLYSESSYVIRHVQKSDIDQIQNTYKAVASTSTTLALHPHEITYEYIAQLINDVVDYGVGLVVVYNKMVIGWMLKQRYHLETSKHILYGGNIAIHPDHQNKGLGSKVITTFLQEIATYHHDILRVEIFAAEHNPAYHLYKRLGFVEEGIFKNAKIHPDGTLESYYTMTWFNPNYQYHHSL